MRIASKLHVLSSLCVLAFVLLGHHLVLVQGEYVNSPEGSWANLDVVCPDGSAMVGACSSGFYQDCEIPSKRSTFVSHVIRCEKLDSSWFSTVSTLYRSSCLCSSSLSHSPPTTLVSRYNNHFFLTGIQWCSRESDHASISRRLEQRYSLEAAEHPLLPFYCTVILS
jgi:hypothetical protein